QMPPYNANPSVPKTLIRHLIRWVADREETGASTRAVLRDILATAIRPELVPGKDPPSRAPSTEKPVGPFDLHDFSLYYTTRRGYRPAKVAYLEACAWGRGVPGGSPGGGYSLEEIFRWLALFLDRFFRLSQFKRS